MFSARIIFSINHNNIIKHLKLQKLNGSFMSFLAKITIFFFFIKLPTDYIYICII